MLIKLKTVDTIYNKIRIIQCTRPVAIRQNGTVKDIRDNNAYMIGKLKDGRCWMLDSPALDPTDPTTAANMNASNTNASAEAITNYLYGGSTKDGWSNVAVEDVDNESNNNGSLAPRINNSRKDTLIASYGPASANGQAKVGIYYNFCAASVGTKSGYIATDLPNTEIDAPQDICSANWRILTADDGLGHGEYHALMTTYPSDGPTNVSSLEYNLSITATGWIQKQPSARRIFSVVGSLVYFRRRWRDDETL